MALQNIGYASFPEIYAFTSTPFNSILLDAATDRYAYVVEVPFGDSTKQISEIGFRTRAVTTSQSLDCRVETVDAATGAPTGTLYGSGSGVANAGAFSADTYYTFSFGATGATVTAGDKIAVVIQYTSTAGSLNLATFAIEGESAFPYRVNNLTGAYAKVINDMAVGHIKYTDGTYLKAPICPLSAYAEATAYNSGSSPNERGVVWIPRFKCRIAGVRGNFKIAGDAQIVMYDSITSAPNQVAATATIDKDQLGSNNFSRRCKGFYFTAGYVVTPGTKYFISLKPTTTTSVNLAEIDVAAAGHWAHMDLGEDLYHGTRSGGVVTETTTKRAYISFIIDQLDDGAGGGAGGVSRGRLLNSGGF